MAALDLYIVISHLHIELIRRKVLDIQVDGELVSVRPHLKGTREKERATIKDWAERNQLYEL